MSRDDEHPTVDLPPSWVLAMALDDVARAMGWEPFSRDTSPTEVRVGYRRAEEDAS